MSRAGWLVFALSLGASAYFYQAGSWNANTRYDLTRTLVERRALDIGPYAENTGDLAIRDGVPYADKAPGLSLLAAPVYAAVLAADAPARESDRFQARASYLMTVWSVAVPSAFAAMALLELLRLLGVAAGWRLLGTLGYALGTLAWPYSTLFYGHQAAAAFVFVAFVLLARLRRGEDAPSPLRLAGIGLLLGTAVLVEYTAAMTAGVVGLYGLSSLRERRAGRAAALALGFALPVAVLLAYHWAAFGGPLTLPYGFSNQQPRHSGVFMGIGLPALRALRYLTVDPYRGLFFSAPWLLLAAPGLALLLRRAGTRAEGAVMLVLPLAHLWLASSLADWHGGWTFGPRHLVLALPYLAAAAASVGIAPRGRVAGGAAAALVAFSITMIGIATAVKPEVPRAVEHPFGDYLLPSFAEGRLALNTQSVDMATGRGHEQRWAWNWGQRLGLDGLTSLLPLLGYLGVAAWLAARELRRGG